MKQLAIFLIMFFLKINVFSQPLPCAWFNVCANDAWDAELAANPKPIAFVDYVDTLINPIIFGDSAISEVWKNVNHDLPINRFYTVANRRSPVNAADFTGSIKILYDNSYLYLLVSVIDNSIVYNYPSSDIIQINVVPYPNEYPKKTIKREQWTYWVNEGAHMLLVYPTGEYEEHEWFCPLCETTDFSYLGLKEDVFVSSKKYEVEVAISFSHIMENSLGNPFPAGPDTAMGFNVAVTDRDTSDAGTYVQASWSTTNNDIWATNLYCGILKFKSAETGVKYSNSYDVSISPNPVNDILNVKGITLGKIQIVNLMGVEVLKEKIEPSINVSKLATGVYFISIYDDMDKLVSVQKLLKY